MVKKKPDRRVKYTKDVLKDTLIQLMAENHISKISVKKICEIADVNRSTFYAHYDNQYDLLNQIERETIADVHQFIAKEKFQQVTLRAMLCFILEYAAQNTELFRILLSERSDSSFRKEIMKLVRDQALVEAQLGYESDAHIIEYIRLFSIVGSLSVVDKWLEDGMVDSIDDLADLLLTLLNLGISGYQQMMASNS